jgi:hypothetical protein
LGVSFWPAALCAWCYPLTAFFALWQGFPTGLAACWLPWIFLAVDETVRGDSFLAPVGLSLVTFFVLTSGHIDVAGQVLLGSGIYAVWRLADTHRGAWLGRKLAVGVTTLALGWGLGFLLAAPHLLPLLEYASTGVRIMQRGVGGEERPPLGLASLPQALLPDLYGSAVKGSKWLSTQPGYNLLESPAAAYAGIVATFLIAPLAWFNQRNRRVNLFFMAFALLGLTWCLNIPGFVQVLRLPVLNMMSHNRLVFWTAFAILSMTAIGLESLLDGSISPQKWFWYPAGALAGLLVVQFYSSLHWGDKLSLVDITAAKSWFAWHYAIQAILCALALVGWLLAAQRKLTRAWFPVIAVFLTGELLWFDYGNSPQCDPALYFPKIPALQEVSQATPGRVMPGNSYTPASLFAMAGLREIRGYDSVDPFRMITVLVCASAKGAAPKYALSQYLIPKIGIAPPATLLTHPLLNLLNVRYVIFRGTPPASFHPRFQSEDYWVLENTNALPRVFIPKSVEPAGDSIVTSLAAADFNPAETAFVEIPEESAEMVRGLRGCRGTAQILSEDATHVNVSVKMETPGLVILADNWDKGWRATYNGKPTPIVPADFAVRGVFVPRGEGTLSFYYRPASFILGIWLAVGAAITICAWSLIRARARDNQKPAPASHS